MLSDEERAVLQVDTQTAGTARAQRLPHIGSLHESEARRDRKHAGAELLHPRPVGLTLPRRVHDLEVQDQDALVDDLVVFKIADQRGGHEGRVAGQEHTGSRHAIGVLQQFGQRGQRLGQGRERATQVHATRTPGGEHAVHAHRERQRHPTAGRYLGHIAGDKDPVHAEQAAEQRAHGQRRPPPLGHGDKGAQDGGDEHGADDSGTVRTGQGIGGAEAEYEQAHAYQQQQIHDRYIDLALLMRRGLQDAHAWQQVQLDGLARDGEGPGYDCL